MAMDFKKPLHFFTFHIPVLLLKAKTEEKDKQIGIENNAKDYITKPFLFHELRKIAEKHI